MRASPNRSLPEPTNNGGELAGIEVIQNKGLVLQSPDSGALTPPDSLKR